MKEVESNDPTRLTEMVYDDDSIKEKESYSIKFFRVSNDETKEIPLPPAAPIMSGTHTVTKTHWRVIDHELIPRRYLRIDSISVESEVRLHKMKTKIPGIEVYEETDVRRSRS